MPHTVPSEQPAPIQWFADHLEQITQIVHEACLRFGERLDPDEADREFSEMNICWTWDDIARAVQLPDGFRKVDGLVSVDNGHPIPEHVWLEHMEQAGPDEDEHMWWLCHTPAQFMLENVAGVQRGDRIRELERRAAAIGRPDLIYRVGKFCLLYGLAQDIMALGIEYIAYGQGD